MRYASKFKYAMQFGLIVAICVAPVNLVTNGYANPPQVQATDAAGAADQAYREAAANEHSAAIRDFRRALATEPSNIQWRKDLGFTYLAAGLPQQARSEFQTVYAEHPDDFGAALQLGLISQGLRRDEEAEKYFEQASRSPDPRLATQARNRLEELRASRQRELKQSAYEMLAQKRSRDALELFERIHRNDPKDAATTLQLGYLYASANRPRDAKQMFAMARQDSDPVVKTQAKAGWDQARRDSRPWFASIYAAPFYQSRFSNEINPVIASIGLKTSRYFQPYVGLRFTRDLHSRSGTLPRILSDNSAVLSAGIQIPLANTGITAFAEAGIAINLLDQGPRAIPDYRAGLRWFRPWGHVLAGPRAGHQPISMTGSAYADVAYYTRYDDNIIGYLQLREGVNLPAPRVLPMQLLAAVNFVKDSRGQFYNNVAEAGPALRIGLFRVLPGLSMEAQYLRGFYVTHDLSNPYGPRYGDFRVFLIWSRSF